MGRTETLPKREDYVHMGIVLSNALHRGLLVAGIGISLAGFGSEQAAEASIRNRLRGTVSVMGKPVANASVTLWKSKDGQEPEQVKGVRSKQDGSLRYSSSQKMESFTTWSPLVERSTSQTLIASACSLFSMEQWMEQ